MGQIRVTKVKRIIKQVQDEIIYEIESSRNGFVKQIKNSQNKDGGILIHMVCDVFGKRYSTGIVAEKYTKVHMKGSPDYAGNIYREVIFIATGFTSSSYREVVEV